jgi:hypothetical protein
MTVMTEGAVVQRRDIRGNELTLTAAQRTLGVKQDVGQCADRRGDLRTKRKERTNTWNSLGNSNMGHELDCIGRLAGPAITRRY